MYEHSFTGFGVKAFDYQKIGIEFIENSNFNCLLADEMGLGKTPQALLAYKRNKEALSPCLLISKSSLHINWVREYMKWVLELDVSDPKCLNNIDASQLPFVHSEGSLPVLKGFNFYLLSMDMLSKKTVLESVKAMGFKSIIIDECHNFNSESSKRTESIRKIRPLVPHLIALSGTPILNRTAEYFPILNLLKPNHYPERKQFLNRYLDFSYTLKKFLGFTYGGKERFFRESKSFILRREVKDVQKDLPEVFYQKHYVADFEKTYVKQYNKLTDELEELMHDRKGRANDAITLLGILANLRHLTGLMKIQGTIEHIKEFLENTDEKITIGIHHELVRSMLMSGLSEYNPIEISGADNGFQKDDKITLFKTAERRVLIANILAGGEGLNLQFCNNCIIVERQWNPGKEDQFIKRFHRHGQMKSVFVSSIIAADTIDDFFEQLIELKRNIVTDTTNQNFEADHTLIHELAKRVVSTRLKYTGI